MSFEKKTKKQLLEEIERLQKRLQEAANTASAGNRPEKGFSGSGKMFEVLAEKSPNMIFINQKGRVLFANEKCEEIMGYSKEEFYADDFNFMKLIAPEHEHLVKQSFKRHLKGEELKPYEYALVARDGTRINSIITTKLIDYGTEKAILGIVTDITHIKKVEQSLRRRLDFEKTVTAISSRFVGSFDLDEAINQSMADLGEFSGAGRAYIFMISDDGNTLNNTHEWCARGISSQIENLKNLPADRFKWWMEKLHRGETIHIEDVSKMPPQAKAEREMLEMQQIKSLLVLPLTIGGKLSGFIGFDNTKTTGRWNDENIRLIQIFSQIIGNVFERLHAKEALLESEEIYRAIITKAHDIIWMIDKKGIFTFVNKRAEEITGYRASDIVGDHFSSYVYEEDMQLAYESFQKTMQGHSQSIEIRIKDAHKKILVLSVNTTPIYRNDEIIGNAGFGRDITGHKKALQALQKSEQKFRNIVEQSEDGIVITDEKGVIIDWNRGEEQMTGLKRSEVLGRYIWDVQFEMTPEDQREPDFHNRIKNMIQAFLKTGKAPWLNLPVEKEIQTPDGRRLIIQSVAFKMKSEKGFMIGSITRDVTEQKKVEHALRESDRRNEALLQAIPDMIFVLTGDGTYIDVRTGKKDELLIPKEEIIGKNIREIGFSGEDVDAFLKSITHTLATGEVQTLEYDLESPTGFFSYEVRIARLNENEVIANVRNITERKKLEEEHIKTEKLESLGMLAGGLAHDFNNLLTAILGNISVAHSFKISSEKVSARLVAAEKAAMRARDLTQQLLTFSMGGLPVKKVVSLAQLVKDTVSFSLSGTNVKCKFDIPSDLALAEVDEGQMSQVFQNIIINSVQAMPRGGQISVTCRNVSLEEGEIIPLKKGNYIKISMKDQGIGIPETHLSRIFDPYFTTKVEGTGLGLSIAQRIIEEHGGNISVESQVGKGTT
ncbi:MAG: PAS domain S-box protein, partial [Calditrichia bacterium]